MPSQKQLRWAQLRVGLTVLFASITLAVLIFLMSGTTGIFTRKLTLFSYVDNASGLRVGAPVRLQGVDVGNVKEISVVPNPPDKRYPVKIELKVSSRYEQFLHKDSKTKLSTAGVLGETFVDIDSTGAKGPMAQDGDVLAAQDVPDIQDVVKSTQGTLENLDVLLKRVDRIVAAVEDARGSIGKLIYDKELYNNLNSSVREFQSIMNEVNSGSGTIGKLLKDEQMYEKANLALDRLNKTLDDVQKGQGTVGRLIQDPTLYNNANQTISKANQLIDKVNSGQGALGKFTSDQEFARKIDNTITKLSQITDRLEAGEGTAGKLLRDPSLYTNTDQMLVETRQLVKAIRENPKKYLTIRFKIF